MLGIFLWTWDDEMPGYGKIFPKETDRPDVSRAGGKALSGERSPVPVPRGWLAIKIRQRYIHISITNTPCSVDVNRHDARHSMRGNNTCQTIQN
jgi:non-ribosomal peptide synthetase component F